jgi:endonuclease G
MRAAVAAAAAAALSASALAGCIEELPPEMDTASSEILGGTKAPAGKWPEIAAVLWSGQQMCTGVLIAPTVALTAGHCNDPTLKSIVVGTSSLARVTEGETLSVVQRIEYPSSAETEDLTVLVLAKESRFPPRALATGWARADIRNGASVAIAGFGAINRDATMYVNDLQEAETTITDADCTQKPGCHAGVAPGGELGAGGMGTDTCRGDSGGPLYLQTSYGTFVAGITSRAYENAQYECSGGGIYARPDKVIDWIEQSAGVPVLRGPEPSAEKITVVRGGGAETAIRVNDPKTKQHRLEIVAPPSRGTAAVRDDGRVRVCIDPAAAPGDDAVTVKIADRADAARALEVRIPVIVEDGEPDAEECSVDDFEGGGCCSSSRSSRGSLPLAIGVLAVLRRRHRRSSPVLR